MNTKIIPSESMGGDHRLLVVEFKKVKINKIVLKKKPRIKVWELENEVKKMAFQDRIRTKLPTNETGKGIEEWNNLRQTFVEEASQICGKTNKNVREKETPWWTERVKMEIKERNNIRKELFKEKQKRDESDESKINRLHSEYKRLKLQVKRSIKEEQDKCWGEFADKIEVDSRGNMKLLYKVIKSKRTEQERIKA